MIGDQAGCANIVSFERKQALLNTSISLLCNILRKNHLPLANRTGFTCTIGQLDIVIKITDPIYILCCKRKRQRPGKRVDSGYGLKLEKPTSGNRVGFFVYRGMVSLNSVAKIALFK